MVIKPNSTTSSSQINVIEREIVALILEFLESRKLNLSQVTLERETGIVSGSLSEEVLFLRNLIIEGLWDDAVEYVEPLSESPEFDYTQFKKVVFRYKYLELLCIKSEVGNVKFSDNAAISCLRDLESVCGKNEFNEYRLLLSYPRIQEHPEYSDWNPSSARVRCFSEVRPLVDTILQLETMDKSPSCIQSPENRLVHLLIKGILYETAGRLCAQRAKKQTDDLRFTSLLPKSSPSPDMTLLSWLQAIPVECFACKFEEKNLPLNYQKFDKPLLEASWTEIIQQAPIRTKPTGDGESSLASSRVQIEDRMVQSMVEQMDGFRRKSFGAGSHSARNRGLSQSFHLVGLGQEDPFISGIFSDALKQATALGSHSARAKLVTVPETPQVDDATRGNLSSDFRQNCGEPLSPLHENVAFENEGYESPSAIIPTKPLTSREDRQHTDTERKRLQSEWEDRERQRESLMAQILCTPGVLTTNRVSDGSSSNTTNSDPTTPLKPEKTTLISPLNNTESATPAPHWESSHLAVGDSPVVKYRMESESPSTKGFSSPQLGTPKKVEVRSGLSSAIAPPPRTDDSPDSFLSGQPKSNISRAFNDADVKALTPQFEDTSKHFLRVQVVEDGMFVRCAAFHPSGEFYAVGSNSRILRICSYPNPMHTRSLRPEQVPIQAPVVDSRVGYHKGALFCVAWSPDGQLLATGSNDRLIKLCRFSSTQRRIEDLNNMELKFHDDTIRDIIFMEDARSSTSVMISGGADAKIGITDCATATCFQKLTDHTATILSLYSWGSSIFVSGSQDKTCRLWDLRSLSSSGVITQQEGLPGSEVTCVRVDKDGKLLVSSHENGQCMLWDLRANKVIQVWQAHRKEIRGIALTSKSNLLLTGSYDKTVVAHSMEGNLSESLPAVIVANHSDKIIQCHLHPRDMSFLTTSADKTCVLWAYPEVPSS